MLAPMIVNMTEQFDRVDETFMVVPYVMFTLLSSP